MASPGIEAVAIHVSFLGSPSFTYHTAADTIRSLTEASASFHPGRIVRLDPGSVTTCDVGSKVRSHTSETHCSVWPPSLHASLVLIRSEGGGSRSLGCRCSFCSARFWRNNCASGESRAIGPNHTPYSALIISFYEQAYHSRSTPARLRQSNP